MVTDDDPGVGTDAAAAGSPAPPGSGAECWRRDPRWVHRLVPDHAMLAAVGGEVRTLGGLALAVWIVLDEPAGLSELVRRMADLWPEAAVDAGAVEDAVRKLVASGVVIPAGPPELR